MRVSGYKKLDDCAGENYYNEIQFDCKMTAEIIEAFAGLGTLEFQRDFPRPFFILKSPDGFVLKGLQGDDTCRLVITEGKVEAAVERIKEFLDRQIMNIDE